MLHVQGKFPNDKDVKNLIDRVINKSDLLMYSKIWLPFLWKTMIWPPAHLSNPTQIFTTNERIPWAKHLYKILSF